MEQTDFAATDPTEDLGIASRPVAGWRLGGGAGSASELALWVIFAAAIAEAYVIGRYYMRLRSEDVLIYTLVLLPVALVIVLAFVLVPDIVRH